MAIRPSVLQRRRAEQGRIRLGVKGDRGQPVKLAAFRFTSPNEAHIRALAERYGGEARPWRSPAGDEWEVLTDAKSIPVTVLKENASQWLETWSGGGCVHRCDGEVIHDPVEFRGVACLSQEDTTTVTIKEKGQDNTYRAHEVAKPTTRVGMMLPELASTGAWRMESHGWNAAAEIPEIASLAAYVGDLVPARLHLVERRAVSGGQTKRFVVPVIDLEIGAARLREVVELAAGMSTPQLGGGGHRELAAGGQSSTPGVDPYDPWFGEVSNAVDRAGLSRIWSRMVAEQLVGTAATPSVRLSEFIAAWQQRAREVPEHAEPRSSDETPAGEDGTSPSPAEPDAEGIVDAELVEEGDADAAWQRVLAVGGDLNMSTPDLDEGFAAWLGDGTTAADATAEQLNAYAEFLRRTT